MVMSYKLADGSLSTDYKVGDKFEVVSGLSNSGVSIGTILEFLDDDGTPMPAFDVSGGGGYEVYVGWEDLVPHQEQPKFINSVMKNSEIAQLGLLELGYKFKTGDQQPKSLTIKFLYTNECGALSLSDHLDLSYLRNLYAFKATIEDGNTAVTAKLKQEKDSAKLYRQLKSNYREESFGLMVEDIKSGKIDFLKFTGKD
jgi:hypothetical protein